MKLRVRNYADLGSCGGISDIGSDFLVEFLKLFLVIEQKNVLMNGT